MPHAAPCVDLVAEEGGQLKIIEGRCQSIRVAIVGPVLSFTRSGGARAQTDGGEEKGTRVFGARFRLIDSRHRQLYVLIRRIGLLFESIQLTLVKYAPPIAVCDVRRTGVRRAAFFEIRRNWRDGLVILGADHATGQRQTT